MNGYHLGRLVRMLRHRAALTQQELGDRAGVARWKLVKLEAGELDGLRFGDVERLLAALDGRLDVRGSYHGAAGDRLLDERHALILGARATLLRRYEFVPQSEVSFSEYGERGSIDLMGWHAARRALLVEEIKSELGSIEGTLRPFDAKCRLASKIARERFGWHPLVMARILVLPEESAARRAVERHAAVLDSALPARSRDLRSWLRKPVGHTAGIWFQSAAQHVNAKRNPSAILRVRSRRPRSDEAA